MADDGSPDFPAGNDDNSGGGMNPAWNDLLQELPADLHEKVTPHLSKWDSGVNQRFESLNNQIAPFKEFLDSDVNPEHLRMGMGILNALENNPREIYDLIGQQFNFAENGQSGEQDKTGNNVSGIPAEDLEGLPESVVTRLQQIDKLEAGLETVAKRLLEEQEQKNQAAEDAKLQRQIEDLKKKHGEFDERYVLTAMHLGAKPDQAIKQWEELVNKIVTEHSKRSRAPQIIGGGSLVPGEKPIDVTKMDTKTTKNYVAALLAQHAAEREG